MTITDSPRTQGQAVTPEPTGVGLGVWLFSAFLGLLAICISIAALAVSLSHETTTTTSTAAAAPAPVKTPVGADTVALREYNVSVAPPTLAPGNHDFTIANDGRTEHELLVFHTNI